MRYTIVPGNKPSSVALHQNYAIEYLNALMKCQIFILNPNMPKTNLDGAEESTIKNF